MSSIVLRKSTRLTTSFVPTKGFAIVACRVSFRFKFTVAAGTPAVIEYYMEFGEDPNPAGVWYREMAEEDAGNGVVAQPTVVRTLQDVNGATFAAGTYSLSAQFRREEQLARMQIKASAGVVTMEVSAPFGQLLP